MSVISFIEHYQRSIKKSDNDENRLLHCLKKLADLQVKVSDLQATGIGRTVNSLRKKPGKVGETVRSLVAKWMELVESHMTEDEDAQDNSGDENNVKENGFKDHSFESNRMFAPDNISSTNGKDCNDKDDSLKNHHSSRSRGEEKESKSKQRHTTEERNKHDSKNLHGSEHSKSHHRSSRDDKERHSSSSKRHRDDKYSKKVKKEPEDDEDSSSSKKPKISSSESGPKVKEERVSPPVREVKKEKHREPVRVKKERNSPELGLVKEEKVKVKREPGSPERKPKIKKERPTSPEPKVKREERDSKPSTSRKTHAKVKMEVKKEEPESDDAADDSRHAGSSFADVLGELDSSPSKKSKEKKKKGSSKPSSFKPLPRSEELASLLDQPALTYRPLPHVPQRSAKPAMSEGDALSAVMLGNKNQRTKVYSGTKAFQGEVTTLQDMCIKILQENIDALEHVGSVPYFLLEPVFVRANAFQLARLEHFNAQFTEEFDDLWKQLVNTEFKLAVPQEYECWREVYERSLGERNDKMAQLAAKIKANNEARKAPQRTTKLAFEHSQVKPPRSVRKQQEKHGTARGVLPMRRTVDIGEAGPSSSGSTPRDRENTLARTVGLLREGPSTAIKGKKRPAPLMQKTLKFMKTNFRR